MAPNLRKSDNKKLVKHGLEEIFFPVSDWRKFDINVQGYTLHG